MKPIFKILLILLMVLPGLTSSAQTDTTHKSQKQPVTSISTMPSFPGGADSLTNFLKRNIFYPAGWPPDSIPGTVYVAFIVDENGNIKNIKLLKRLHPTLDQAAIDAILRMPAWIPAQKEGKPVSAMYNVPVTFGKKP